MPDRPWQRIAFCPHPPLLINGMGGLARVAEVAPVSGAAHAAVHWVVEGAISLAVLGAGPDTRRYPSGHLGSTRAFGPDLLVRLGSGSSTQPDPAMPLSLLVAANLLPATDLEVSAWSVGPEATADELAQIAIDAAAAGNGRMLVMGDGSIRRRTDVAGPIAADPVDFDNTVADLLASGSAVGLGELDTEAASALGVAGIRPWQVAAEVARILGPSQAALDAYAAPFGIGYFVARWSR